MVILWTDWTTVSVKHIKTLFSSSSHSFLIPRLTRFVFFLHLKQEQILIASRNIVLVNAWKDFIESICSRNVTNVEMVDWNARMSLFLWNLVIGGNGATRPTKIDTKILLKIFWRINHRQMPTWCNFLIQYQRLTNVWERNLAKAVWILSVKMVTKDPFVEFAV